MIVRFNNEITDETVESLILSMEQYEFVDLYFSTDGGYLTEMQILIDCLNKRAETDSVKIHLCDYVISAGTLFLWEYDGPLFIHRSFKAFVFHYPDVGTVYSRKTPMHKIGEELLEEVMAEFLDEYKKLGLSKAQLAEVKKGGDVHITKNELSKLKINLFGGEQIVKQLLKVN